MKKILITGGAGFIGSEIVNQLYSLKDFYDVTVLDCMTKQIHGENWKKSYLYKCISGKCNFVHGDIKDYDIVYDNILNNDIIIHLAAETGTGQSMYEINRYNNTNIMGTSNILQACSNAKHKARVKKIILASSRAVYGEGKYHCSCCGDVYPVSRKKEKMLVGDFNVYCPICGLEVSSVPTSEDSKISPGSLYAFTKYAQEMLIATMCPALEIDYTIFRLQNVYGIGQSLKNPYTGILSIFSTLMLENKPVNIFENGMESRDFINVKDIARGIISAIECDRSNGGIINLGSGTSKSVKWVAEYLKDKYKSTSSINITGDFRTGDIANNVADVSLAKNILGFECHTSIEEGLELFCDWVSSEKQDGIEYEKSLMEMENYGMFIRR